MKKIVASVAALAAVGAVPAFAESQPGDIGPESATLPENVVRVRLALGSFSFDSAYDKDGKAQSSAAKVSGLVGAAVLEGGFTSKLSGQLYVPYQGEMELEANDDFAFASQGMPSRAFYEGYIKSANDKQKNSGIGDIEVGAKYNLSSVAEPVLDGVPLYASVALGFRLPTGANVQKDGKAAIGDGTTDLGLRLNADYKVLQGVLVQVENQSEFMLAKGKTWDDDSNKEVDFEYDGIRNVGYGKLVVAPGAWFAPVDVLSVNTKYGWDYKADEKENGVAPDENSKGAYTHSLTMGASLNGFVYQIPLQLDLDYTMPMSGKNTEETTSMLATLKAFYKF